MKLRTVYYDTNKESWCVPLTKGHVALIDEDDVERVSKYNWYSMKGKHTHYGAVKFAELSTTLHRFVLGAEKDQKVDHKNGDGLDNRKANLRFCSYGQNNANSRKVAKCASIYKGVTFDDTASFKWKARLYKDGKQKVLGRFATEQEAALAYNRAAVEVYGEFAKVNQL